MTGAVWTRKTGREDVLVAVLRAATGLLAAQMAPGLAISFGSNLTRGSLNPEDIIGGAVLISFFALFVSVPLTLVFALPVVCLFGSLGWRGWPPYAIAGVVIGNIPIYGSLATDIGWLMFWSSMGAISASAYWLVALGRVRAWSLFGGLLLFAIVARAVLDLAA